MPLDRLCDHCHKPLATDDRFCPRCGRSTDVGADPEATLVDPVAARVRADTPPSGTPLPFKDRLQQALGREYETIGLTGQGGFARVYRAQDKRLNRMVAIKVLKPDLLEIPDIVDRFRAEGVALAKLRHPGIVPIFDIRERDGLIYYIMPFVHGATLESRLEHRVSALEARRILSELANALSAAHGAQ